MPTGNQPLRAGVWHAAHITAAAAALPLAVECTVALTIEPLSAGSSYIRDKKKCDIIFGTYTSPGVVLAAGGRRGFEDADLEADAL